jgi:hypothetical protein
MHNRVHAWVGGSMLPHTSPNDPVFFLHHCFIDKLWADWQKLHEKDVGYQPYLPDGGAAPGHNLKDRMPPWNDKTPENVLNTRDLGYHYDNDNYLMANDALYPGQSIRSANGFYTLSYDYDVKNLRLLAPLWKELWATSSDQHPDADGVCCMQPDGNLVISGIHVGYTIYMSNTGNNPKGYLQVEEDGHLQMYQSDKKPINWRVPPPDVGNPAKG